MINKKFNYQLEALRGFAALMVVFGHSMQFSQVLCNGYDFKRRAFNYFAPTHLMVKVFFTLSGLIITLKTPFQLLII